MHHKRTTILATALLTASVLAGCATEPSAISMDSTTGEQMYMQLCASCHGANGQGTGPVGPSLKVKVPDLTRIAWREGGEFPSEDVKRSIDGRIERMAHGTRDMPVWGIRFFDLSNPDRGGEQARVNALLDRLVEYLETIQVEQ
jgi:mono/diheme cytochrome c family protein